MPTAIIGRTLLGLLVALLLALWTAAPAVASIAAFAQARMGVGDDTPIATPAIPDSSAGERLEQILEWINGADIEDHEAIFADEFLQQVPPSMLGAVRQQLFDDATVELLRIDAIEQAGDLLRTTVRVDHDDADTEYLSLLVGVDADDRITTLLVQPGLGPEGDRPSTWAELDDALDALPGELACAAYELVGEPSDIRLAPVWERRPDRRLALGSAFKLWVLGAVAEDVARGERAWDSKVTVRDDQKSLPGGQMQLEPDGTELDLRHVATEMIRISDNTATDHLIRLVGREEVEAFMSKTGVDDERNTPFLTTKEMFQVKLGGDMALRDRFAEGGVDEKRALVAPDGAITARTPSMMLASAWLKPIHIDTVEWFASPRELARVMATLRTMEHAHPTGEGIGHALRQNPGMPFDQETWPVIGFKGGSEPGVLNLTWQLQRDDGRWFCLTFGWNDTNEPVDMGRLMPLTLAAAQVLGAWDRD
ncbi:MAG: serine hydrolase [Planctomycetota bacterium]